MSRVSTAAIQTMGSLESLATARPSPARTTTAGAGSRPRKRTLPVRTASTSGLRDRRRQWAHQSPAILGIDLLGTGAGVAALRARERG
jgi:hypothetical protein